MESTVRFEAEVARRNSPDFAWPTLALTTTSLAVWVASSWLAIEGTLPLWLAMLFNTLVMYVLYTPVHEAAHSAVIPRRKDLRWVNAVVGTAAALPILMFFHHHRKQHFVHHARTNQPDDPDQFAFGSFSEVAFVKTPGLLLNFLNGVALWRDCRAIGLPRRETAITMIEYALVVALIVGLVIADRGYELLMLWLVPWFVGMYLMQIFFAWFPHHDHSETGRYRNTRIALFPGGDTLFLYQNLHLIHHMLPAVPFYRYRAVFDELRPTLEAHGARIEGFWPYSRPTAA